MDELDKKYFSDNYLNFKRSRYGLKPGDKLLGLMPGSRRSELKYHLETQVRVARRLVKEDPQLKVGLLVAPTFEMGEIRELLSYLDFPLMFIKDQPFEMIHMTDAVLCASGTATLLVGLMEKPLVIMYKMNPITAFLARRLVKETKYFGMVNLILGKEVGEEYFQERASIENLAEATKKVFMTKTILNIRAQN